MIVLDASVALEVLLRTPDAGRLEAVVFDPTETLHSPHLIDLEVAQVLRRYVSTGQVDAERCKTALVDLNDIPLTRYPHNFILPRIWELRNNFTAYDAAYVALAEALEAPLLTRDQRLAKAPGHHAQVKII